MLATDYEEVRYEYTGSTEDLQRATDRAIKVLERAQYQMEAVSEQSIEPDTSGLDFLKQRINQLVSEANKLKDSLTSMTQTGAATKQAVDAAKELQKAVRSLCTVYIDFNDVNEQTTYQVNAMASAMRQVAAAFRRVQQAADDTSRALPVVTGSSAQSSQALPAVAAGGSGGGGGNALTGAIGAIGGDSGSTIGALAGASTVADLSQVLAIIRGIINAIKQLVNLYKKVDNAWKKFIQWNIDQLNKLLTVILKVVDAVVDGLNTFVDLARKATQLVGNLTTGFGALSTAAGAVADAFKDIVGAGIGVSLAEAIKQSIDFSENLNLFQVALGNSAEAGQKFVDAMQEWYGMDPSNILASVGYFYQMSDAIGSNTKAAETMSMGLTKAANDISSLFNVDIETVQNNLASGMQGMSRAVRKYGMDIRAVTLKQTALSLGMDGNTARMNEATLQGLRYVTMMRQAKNAMNDFSNTIESPANQIRIFKEQITQLARAIGNFFIPVLQKVLPLLNGIVMAIRVILTFIGTLIGLDFGSFNSSITAGAGAAEDEADALEGVGDAAASAKKDIDNLLAPFDELNILQEKASKSSGGGSGGGIGTEMDPKLLAEIERLSASFDKVRMKANQVRDAILEVFGLTWDGSKIQMSTDGFMQRLVNMWKKADFKGFGAEIANLMNKGIQWAFDNTKPEKFMAKIERVITNITDGIRGFVSTLDWGGIGATLGNLWTNALYTVYTAVNTFPWEEVGSALYDYVAGLFGNIPWSDVSLTLFTGLSGINKALLAFVDKINWPAVEKEIVTFINNTVVEAQRFVDGLKWSTFASNLGVLISKTIQQVDWAGATNLLCSFVGQIASAVTAFLSKIDWGAAIRAIGTIVNTMVLSVRKFISEINWIAIGKDIAMYVNQFFAEIDWAAFGDTLKRTIEGFLDAAVSFVVNADWNAIFKDIEAFLDTLDWGEIMLELVQLLMEAFKLKWKLRWEVLSSFISSFFTELWHQIVFNLTGGLLGSNRTAEVAKRATGNRTGFGGGRVTPFATGGVVTKPTMALIGEGKHNEAVIPLGNSPQMDQMLNKFAQIAAMQGSATPQVNVYIGQEQFDAYTYKASERGKTLVGRQPVVLGGT